MPLYDDRFAGHMDTNDPRTPVHGAAGCVWPTVPAWRYRLKSTTASGVFSSFNIDGGLLIKVATAIDHDDYRYFAAGVPSPFSITLARKVWVPATGGFEWQIDLNLDSGLCIIPIRVPFAERKCNFDVILGNWFCKALPFLGSTGSTYTMHQVEWDKTDPP